MLTHQWLIPAVAGSVLTLALASLVVAATVEIVGAEAWVRWPEWQERRTPARHRGRYQPKRHWTCPTCTENCGCPIYLGTSTIPVMVWGHIDDGDMGTATISTATDELLDLTYAESAYTPRRWTLTPTDHQVVTWQGPGPGADATRSADRGTTITYPRGGERTRVRPPKRTHTCNACGASTFGTREDTTQWFTKHAATHHYPGSMKQLAAAPSSAAHVPPRYYPHHEVLPTPPPSPPCINNFECSFPGTCQEYRQCVIAMTTHWTPQDSPHHASSTDHNPTTPDAKWHNGMWGGRPLRDVSASEILAHHGISDPALKVTTPSPGSPYVTPPPDDALTPTPGDPPTGGRPEHGRNSSLGAVRIAGKIAKAGRLRSGHLVPPCWRRVARWLAYGLG